MSVLFTEVDDAATPLMQGNAGSNPGALQRMVASRCMIRAALGASKLEVGRLVFMELVWLIFPGMVLGGVGCIFLANLQTPMLYGIGRYDFAASAGAVLVVLGIGLADSSHPVGKAVMADPISALREE